MPYLNKNIFTDLLMFLPALCVFVRLLFSQINPTKCVNPPKCAVQTPAGGKNLILKGMAVRRRLNVVGFLFSCYCGFSRDNTAAQVEVKSADTAQHLMFNS